MGNDSQSQLWHVDLHVHSRFSPDCLSEPEHIIARALRLGLQRVAITDHNTIAGAVAARAISPEMIIVGEEIEVAGGGEIIAYFVSNEVPKGLALAEALARLRQQGAVISVSHPCDEWRSSALGETRVMAISSQLDALETFNARCLRGTFNTRAGILAQRSGLLVTAGSDAHTIAEIGCGFLELPSFSDAPSFRSSLRRAAVGGTLSGPWPHLASTYAKWRKRLSIG
jgi:predicted metal-dependent phosphoesterase TrpH